MSDQSYSFDQDGQVDINSPEFSESGKVENKAICNASQALQIAQRLEWNDRDRDIRRARNLGAFNGESPYCPSTLIAKAQGYRYNVSFGFMEGVVGRAVVPYNDLTINISDLTEIEANLNEEKLKIIQAEFGKIMKKWGKWPKVITRLNQDLVLNGYNTFIWPSDYDPFPVFVAQKDGFVDDGSPNDVSDLELFVWRKSYLLHELYAKISDADTAKKAGWNVDNVRKALTEATPENIWSRSSTTSGVWTAVESAIRGGSLYASIVGAKMVSCYHVFAAEIDGKVTHYIILNQGRGDDYESNKDGPELFKKEERFESMRDFLVYFDLETGDGTWHGSKGVAQRVFNTHKANDKMMNSALDTTFTAGLVLLQPADQVSQEELTLTVVGPFAVIPQGIGVQPATLPNVAPTFFQMQALLSGTSEQRVGDVVPQGQNILAQGPETATAARLKAGRQELITRGNLQRYIDPISQTMSIIVRRLLKDNSPNAYAKEFQKELKRKGLTDDDLKEIRGARNTGNIEDILGNTAANTQVIFAEFRGDPDIDQDVLKRRRIASVLDADAADELLINKEDQSKVLEQVRLQEMEFSPILGGLQVPVSPRDNHEAHLKACFEWIGTMVQKSAQQFDPSIVPALKAMVSHAARHVDFLKADKSKKAAYEDAKGKLDDSVDAIKTLEKQGQDLAKANFDAAAKMAQTPEEMAQVQQAQQQLEAQSV